MKTKSRSEVDPATRAMIRATQQDLHAKAGGDVQVGTELRQEIARFAHGVEEFGGTDSPEGRRGFQNLVREFQDMAAAFADKADAGLQLIAEKQASAILGVLEELGGKGRFTPEVVHDPATPSTNGVKVWYNFGAEESLSITVAQNSKWFVDLPDAKAGRDQLRARVNELAKREGATVDFS